jgi:hypothetical protein
MMNDWKGYTALALFVLAFMSAYGTMIWVAFGQP